ncbi:hypothetical protein FOXG_20104 [Fusarium oxysporum f. sp. lycopersici 4287]|uniref:Fungal N-terminal domain-containing protein n=1 Tax=Fusarium oxysporum f. sp. lycopersici (strain 4287 / CBS 123668 / FGSC 9935 / NRRL 34936) TaxID=426428 RepID=A0A0J9VBW3_FUSO4|nr:hypothetical protein FOXG_20104 [Fusarium oxysporum f. sp. lycopersici 4287]KAJ9416146.1 hypothetical protein QL093DRAFT_2104631 [Fusarium oxysporum]KNB08939.1 hypothetical protein FOXG_20104 [Fusarium oxysporum f. sp. lycopersici 4287]
MTTGFEIVGTVCALYQLIHASTGFISECKTVYGGEPTTHHNIKEHAENLAQACDLTWARYETMSSSERLSDAERRVQKTARKCHTSAQALLGELRYMTDKQKCNDCMGAVAYVVKSKLHRKIERIEAGFKNGQQELQTILQSETLHAQWSSSQNKAKKYLEMEGFQNVDMGMQILRMSFVVCQDP